MMDLALRLSEQEASVTASRLQQEEEAVMKAIQESVSTVFYFHRRHMLSSQLSVYVYVFQLNYI